MKNWTCFSRKPCNPHIMFVSVYHPLWCWSSISDSQEYQERPVAWQSTKFSVKRWQLLLKGCSWRKRLNGAAAEDMFTHYPVRNAFSSFTNVLVCTKNWYVMLLTQELDSGFLNVDAICHPVSPQHWAWHPVGAKWINKGKICKYLVARIQKYFFQKLVFPLPKDEKK